MEKIKVIITGTTGMVGEGVMLHCLENAEVEEVLSVSRRHLGIQHPKLKTLVLTSFKEAESKKEELKGYDACFFCLGVSSIGMKEPEYTEKTYDLTLGFAKTLKQQNPEMNFCYVSGSGTDSSEKGRSMWARVKGKTENDLMALFKQAYMFRPGFMRPVKGQQHALKFYSYVNWMYPALRGLFPGFVCTLTDVGKAMVNTVLFKPEKKILEVRDIVELSRKKF